eukprot:416132-Prorocentrum_minimum.AAC.7
MGQLEGLDRAMNMRRSPRIITPASARRALRDPKTRGGLPAPSKRPSPDQTGGAQISPPDRSEETGPRPVAASDRPGSASSGQPKFLSKRPSLSRHVSKRERRESKRRTSSSNPRFDSLEGEHTETETEEEAEEAPTQLSKGRSNSYRLIDIRDTPEKSDETNSGRTGSEEVERASFALGESKSKSMLSSLVGKPKKRSYK